jgi:hypothetical protein
MTSMVEYNSNFIIYCVPQEIKNFSLLISCHHLANIQIYKLKISQIILKPLEIGENDLDKKVAPF